jgi:hypothetical protein
MCFLNLSLILGASSTGAIAGGVAAGAALAFAFPAPEYLSTGKSSEKTDVFGYGIMLLELITGQRAFDLARLANDDNVMLLDWVSIQPTVIP